MLRPEQCTVERAAGQSHHTASVVGAVRMPGRRRNQRASHAAIWAWEVSVGNSSCLNSCLKINTRPSCVDFGDMVVSPVAKDNQAC